MLKTIKVISMLLLAVATTHTVSAEIPLPTINVPDAGSTALLLGGAAFALGATRKFFGKKN